eukprot:6198615-Pleurochrysis_carterae.AAC.1
MNLPGGSFSVCGARTSTSLHGQLEAYSQLKAGSGSTSTSKDIAICGIARSCPFLAREQWSV